MTRHPSNCPRSVAAFSLIESAFMMVAILVFTWICLAVAKKEGYIFKESAAESTPSIPGK